MIRMKREDFQRLARARDEYKGEGFPLLIWLHKTNDLWILISDVEYHGGVESWSKLEFIELWYNESHSNYRAQTQRFYDNPPTDQEILSFALQHFLFR